MSSAPGGRRGPLRSRNFCLLLTGNLVSVAGSSVSFVAVPFAVLRIGGSAADVGYVATAALIALIGCLLTGGVIADRLPRHQVLVAAGALQALAQAIAAALLLAGHAKVWQLAVLSAAAGAGTGISLPASAGLLPQTVLAADRPAANALDRAGRNAAAIGGSALGGVLVGLAGPGWGLAIDAASFAVAGLLRAGLRLPRRPVTRSASMVQDVRAGWREFASRRWLWLIVSQFAVLVAISAAMINVLGPLVADSRLGGARSWGYIVAAYSVGAVIGGLVMIRFRPRRILLAAVASVPMFAAVLFALAVPLPAPADIAAAAAAGSCLEVFAVSWATTLQQEIPPDLLSRVSSYDALGNFALAPAGPAIAGPLAAALGTRTVLDAGGAIVVLLPLLLLLVPQIRRMRAGGPAVPR
jgi:MFS family permease